MLAISDLNVKMAGSHAGVSIGEDGPSQMALEDLVDDVGAAEHHRAVSVGRGLRRAPGGRPPRQHPGPVYIRTTRPKLPVLYDNDETFPIGGCKVLRRSGERHGDGDRRRRHAVRSAQGARRAEDSRASTFASSISTRCSRSTRRRSSTAGRETGRLITVEDHYPAGGIGDAVARAVAPAGLRVTRLAVREIPRSGKPEELLDKFGISATPHRRSRDAG